MQVTRRSFLRQGAAAVGAAALARRTAGGASRESVRKRAAHRRRRIIFNDDGDDVWDPNAGTPDGFVGVRLRHALDTQVDTIFYSTTQSFNYYTHDTKVGEVFLSRAGPFQHNQMQTLLDQGTDPLRLTVEFAQRHGIEAVWTLRMNEVPVYPCISQSGMSRRKPYGPGTGYAVEGWRAAAANAYSSKADGVSLFNLFPAPGQEEHNRMVRQVFTEVGTPATLSGRGKLFCLDNAAHLTACGYTNHIVPYADCLPKTLPAGGELSITLPVGDDVRSARSAALRLQTDRPADLVCRLNGQPFEVKPCQDLNDRLGKHWTVGLVECSAVERGNNRVDIAWVRPDDQPLDVTGLELLVEHG